MRDYFYSLNGKRLMCDTRFIPFPLGGNNYETAVFRVSKNGFIIKSFEPIDIVTSDNENDAKKTHADIINKWSTNAVYF